MYKWIDWDDVPDVMSGEKFRQICHISKKTSAFLLKSGKVPCEISGKKTRCYLIKKSDVLEFLHSRGMFPENYKAPENYYRNPISKSLGLPFALTQQILKKLRQYFEIILSPYDDVLKTMDVVNIIGYSRTAVNRWCSCGKLKFFCMSNGNFIPKSYLLDFLSSEYACKINRKSKWHINALREFNLELRAEKDANRAGRMQK